MKYMVLVNRKFMVAVEHDGSNGGAEHVILDNYQGIPGAQAFNIKEMHTQYFSDIVQDCETISLKELRGMSDEYEQAYVELARAKDAVSDIDNEIERVKKILEDLEHDRYALRKDEIRATLKAKACRTNMNIKED